MNQHVRLIAQGIVVALLVQRFQTGHWFGPITAGVDWWALLIAINLLIEIVRAR